MKNHVWGYVIGIMIFAMVVGIWVWQLPNIIAHASRGEDKGIAGLISGFGGAKTAVNSGLAKALLSPRDCFSKVFLPRHWTYRFYYSVW